MKKLAISNIAWSKEFDSEVYERMAEMGFTGLEIAPTRFFEQPYKTSKSERKQLRNSIESHHISVIAMQSLLYGYGDIQIFNKGTHVKLLDLFEQVFQFGQDFGVTKFIFGSPKNRKYENMAESEAIAFASDIFNKLGDCAVRHGGKLCIEANPKEYGTNFLCNTEEVISFVGRVNNPGIGLHIDTGAMIMNAESSDLIRKHVDIIQHVHISEPWLKPITSICEHSLYSSALETYQGYTSIEIKPCLISEVYDSLKVTSELYG